MSDLFILWTIPTMLDRISSKISGNYNEKRIKELQPMIDQINAIYESYHELSDEEIKGKTPEFQKRIADGESLDDILPEAYATVKQACKRMCGQSFDVKGSKQEWNMIPYDVQLIGGIVLHQSTIAEMKTGEGKTLVAALPTYLNALTGKGVHVVTVNDYLASRDAQWIGYLYQRLGLTIGTVVKGVPLQERREQYGRDITYVENSELGFDYLRDNLVKTKRERNLLRRPLNFALIDEIDSILIDEARTPLIISRPADEPTDKYLYYAKIAKSLVPAKGKKKVSKWFLQERLNDIKEEDEKKDDEDQKGDFFIDEKTKTAILSSQGIEKLEKMLGVKNLYSDIGYQEIHHIENALKAQWVYRNNKEYIIKDGEVMIVDQNTGRAMKGRRFSQGLHQAIEAKEWLPIKRESKTMATITYQNFFKQYDKLAGMTGTATTEGEEFEKIYELGVLAIPTNKPILRVDKGDKVYFSQKAKRNHALEYIDFAHKAGQPILIGTSAIHTSEYVAKMLNQKGIKHSVLNAKFHEQEAKIVENAGRKGSVVVATNMAGRGTDIKLDKELNLTIAKNYASWMKKTVTAKDPSIVSATVYSSLEFERTIDAIQKEFNLTEEQTIASYKSRQSNEEKTLSRRIKLNTNKKRDNTQWFAEILVKDPWAEGAETIEKDLHYGLMILATEKHDSRRIDNQLRGRAGRQGDPGISVFMVALDDDIMRKVWWEKIRSMASLLLSKEELDEMELTQKQFTRSIERGQTQMEWRHFSTRKHLFDYDSVVNKQRQKTYRKRDMMLDALDETEVALASWEAISPVLEELLSLIQPVVESIITEHIEVLKTPALELQNIVKKEFNIELSDKEKADIHNKHTLIEKIANHIEQHIQTAEEKVPHHVVNRLLANMYLQVIDRYRVDHIDTMQQLRDKVGLMSYAQQDPLVIYKKEAYEKFLALNKNIQRDTVINMANIDRDHLQERVGEAQKRQEEKQKQLMEKLQWAKLNEAMKTVNALLGGSTAWLKTEQEKKKAIFQDEDGFEVFELEDSSDENKERKNIAEVIDTNTNKKLRPNDKVNVKYPDGRIEYELKYKKVKADVESGKLTIV